VLVREEPEKLPRSARMAGEESFAEDVDFERGRILGARCSGGG
jgi:hypothetical protein